MSPGSARPANLRKADELPWQLTRLVHSLPNAAECDRSSAKLLEAKTEAGLVVDLTEDYRTALGALAAKHPARQPLRLLLEATESRPFIPPAASNDALSVPVELVHSVS